MKLKKFENDTCHRTNEYFEVLPQLTAQTKRTILKRPMDVRVLVGHVHQFKKKQI
jgi:hypothetical protein